MRAANRLSAAAGRAFVAFSICVSSLAPVAGLGVGFAQSGEDAITGHGVDQYADLGSWLDGAGLDAWDNRVMASYSAGAAAFDVFADLDALAAETEAALLFERPQNAASPLGDGDAARLFFPVLDSEHRGVSDASGGWYRVLAFGGVQPNLAGDALALRFSLRDRGRDVFERLLRERVGMSEVAIERSWSARRLLAEGYVAYDSARRNIDFSFAQDPRDFREGLRSVVGGACRALTTRFNRPSVQAMLVVVATALRGEGFDQETESIGQFLRRVFDVPAPLNETILRHSVDELELLFQDADSRHRLTTSVCRSAFLLRMVLDGRRALSLDAIEWDQESAQMVLRDGEQVVDYNWRWRSDGGAEFFIVPLQYLPSAQFE